MIDYNFFHKNTKIQYKIIEEKNYTYRFLIKILNNYSYKHKEILDIGCGSGAIDFYLAKNGANILGIDVSKKAIDVCIKSSKKLGLDNSTKFKIIDFPKKILNKKFDIIICSETLEHIKEDLLAVKGIRKMIKQEGVVIISVSSNNAPLYKWGCANEFDKNVGHLRRYSIEQLSLMLENEDFKILEIVKLEGLLRNFLFLNKRAGKAIRFLKSYISDLASFFDFMLIPLFGESNILIVAKPV